MDVLSNPSTFHSITLEIQAIVSRVTFYHRVVAFLQFTETMAKFCAQQQNVYIVKDAVHIPLKMARSISKRIKGHLAAISACMLEVRHYSESTLTMLLSAPQCLDFFRIFVVIPISVSLLSFSPIVYVSCYYIY